MRVIAGSARGLPLDVPKSGVRPTMDRVRAAVFSSLGDAVPGARVLDLFAGSGAFGIEALSRGAGSARFVERDPTAVACVRKNLARAKLEGWVEQVDVFRFLETARGEYDLIFADPPYAKEPGDNNDAALLVAGERVAGLLAETGTLILECHPERVPEASSGLDCLRMRRYGGSVVLFLVKRDRP
ncbi:MAG: 16S rRNA (guanine(966)-N(2))-methyltransferase RsmD [Terrimicrobiaceae bacterium]